MRLIRPIIRRMLVAAGGLAVALPTAVFAQTNLQFTSISQTPEQAVQLMWASVSNETYEIDEADALGTNADGSTAWNQLYSGYPSQGTSTFWLDTGNYVDTPPIVHPRYSAARFYRVIDKGPDTTSDEPVVSIVSPTSGAVVTGSLTITVSGNTDQATLSLLLFVDGQEMPAAATVTNTVNNGTNYSTATFVINTCEWWNGQHVLFATARCTSTLQGPDSNGPMLIGNAVSSFVPITFNNLVTEIAFSQPFFDPALGQTQQVTAVFAADSDWTLTITDAYSNTVRTATGSGISMSFNWDGAGNGETNLPAGVYWYYVSAQTNGQVPAIPGGGSSGGGGSLPLPEMTSSASAIESQSTQLWAQPSDGSGIAVPFFVYPPGFDTNDLTIFEAPVSWTSEQNTSASKVRSSGVLVGSGAASPAFSGGSSQGAPAAPVRPPTAPVQGTAGIFGVAYQTYAANGTNGYKVQSVPNGYGGLVQMAGHPANLPLTFGDLPGYATEAENFIASMKQGAWNAGFVDADDQLTINALRGTGSPFNQVDLGLLMLHGTYGTSQDFTANGCEQMYFPITSGTGAQYARMSDMNFGGTGTHGLKWMAICACNSLLKQNWNSMKSARVTPFNSNLHLLLGTDSTTYCDDDIASFWAREMLGLSYPTPQPIVTAWYHSAKVAYGTRTYTNTIILAVTGYQNCSGDTLQNYSSPGGTTYYDSVQVWP